MNHDASDVMRRRQPHALPGLAAVKRFVSAVSPGRALAIVRLTGSDPHNRGIRRRDGDVPDRGHRLFVEYRLPRRAVVRSLPHAAGGHAHKHDIRIVLHDRKIVDAAAHHRGADLPEFQAFEFVRGIRLVSRPSIHFRCGRAQK